MLNRLKPSIGSRKSSKNKTQANQAGAISPLPAVGQSNQFRKSGSGSLTSSLWSRSTNVVDDITRPPNQPLHERSLSTESQVTLQLPKMGPPPQSSSNYRPWPTVHELPGTSMPETRGPPRQPPQIVSEIPNSNLDLNSPTVAGEDTESSRRFQFNPQLGPSINYNQKDFGLGGPDHQQATNTSQYGRPPGGVEAGRPGQTQHSTQSFSNEATMDPRATGHNPVAVAAARRATDRQSKTKSSTITPTYINPPFPEPSQTERRSRPNPMGSEASQYPDLEVRPLTGDNWLPPRPQTREPSYTPMQPNSIAAEPNCPKPPVPPTQSSMPTNREHLSSGHPSSDCSTPGVSIDDVHPSPDDSRQHFDQAGTSTQKHHPQAGERHTYTSTSSPVDMSLEKRQAHYNTGAAAGPTVPEIQTSLSPQNRAPLAVDKSDQSFRNPDHASTPGTLQRSSMGELARAPKPSSQPREPDEHTYPPLPGAYLDTPENSPRGVERSRLPPEGVEGAERLPYEYSRYLGNREINDAGMHTDNSWGIESLPSQANQHHGMGMRESNTLATSPPSVYTTMESPQHQGPLRSATMPPQLSMVGGGDATFDMSRNLPGLSGESPSSFRPGESRQSQPGYSSGLTATRPRIPIPQKTPPVFNSSSPSPGSSAIAPSLQPDHRPPYSNTPLSPPLPDGEPRALGATSYGPQPDSAMITRPHEGTFPGNQSWIAPSTGQEQVVQFPSQQTGFSQGSTGHGAAAWDQPSQEVAHMPNASLGVMDVQTKNRGKNILSRMKFASTNAQATNPSLPHPSVFSQGNQLPVQHSAVSNEYETKAKEFVKAFKSKKDKEKPKYQSYFDYLLSWAEKQAEKGKNVDDLETSLRDLRERFEQRGKTMERLARERDEAQKGRELVEHKLAQMKADIRSKDKALRDWDTSMKEERANVYQVMDQMKQHAREQEANIDKMSSDLRRVGHNHQRAVEELKSDHRREVEGLEEKISQKEREKERAVKKATTHLQRDNEDLKKHIAETFDTGDKEDNITDDVFKDELNMGIIQEIKNLTIWCRDPGPGRRGPIQDVDPTEFLHRTAAWATFVKSVCWQVFRRGFFSAQLGFGTFGAPGSDGYMEVMQMRRLLQKEQGITYDEGSPFPNDSKLNARRAWFFAVVLKEIEESNFKVKIPTGDPWLKWAELFRLNIDSVAQELKESLQRAASLRFDETSSTKIFELAYDMGVLAIKMASQPNQLFIDIYVPTQTVTIDSRFDADDTAEGSRVQVDVMTTPCLRRIDDGNAAGTGEVLIRGKVLPLPPQY